MLEWCLTYPIGVVIIATVGLIVLCQISCEFLEMVKDIFGKKPTVVYGNGETDNESSSATGEWMYYSRQTEPVKKEE